MSPTRDGYRLGFSLFGLAGVTLVVVRREDAASATLSLFVYRFAVHFSLSVLD